VTPDLTVDRLVEDYVYAFHHKMYPVIADSNKLVGCVSTKQLKEIPREEWSRRRVRDISAHCSTDNTISPDADAVQALSQMNRSGISRLMVVEGDRLLGVVALKDMLRFLSLKVELDQ
jgi:predicted transcriptional regulator